MHFRSASRSNLFRITHQGSSRTGTHGNAVPVLFLYNGNVVPVVFFLLYTPIVNCNFPWKSFGYKADSLASCVHACKQHHLSSLMFISLVGPPLTQFNPLPYTLKSGWHMVIGVPMTISQESVTQRKNRAHRRRRHRAGGGTCPPNF